MLLACLVLALVVIASLATLYSFWFSFHAFPTGRQLPSGLPGAAGPKVLENRIAVSYSESFSIAGQMAALWLPQLLATVQAVFSKRDGSRTFSISQLAVAVLVCMLYGILLCGSGWLFFLQVGFMMKDTALSADQSKLNFFEHLRSFQGFLIPVSAVVTTLLASIIEASKSGDEKKPDAKKLRSRRLMSQIRRRR